jgi:hypothetical protein
MGATMRLKPCRTIVRTAGERWREPPFFQPELAYVSLSVDVCRSTIRAAHFAGVPHRVQWYFGRLEVLAFIRFADEPPEATIHLHSLLNHPLTPRPVIEGILAHELLHLVVPRAWEDGRWRSHPVAFRQRERELIPRLSNIWGWIFRNFYRAMKVDHKAERVWIKPRIAHKIIHSFELVSWEMSEYLQGEPDEAEQKLAEECLI